MRRLLHFIFSFPFFYNQMQIFFGANKKKALVNKYYRFVDKDAIILDLGGGTGLYRDLWPEHYRYICLDNDTVKLKGLVHQHPLDFVLLADASRIPIKDQSIDVIFCSSFSHHVSEDVLDKVLGESARVLKVSGKLLFLDAILHRESFLNKFLWNIDRGGHPHTFEQLTSLVGRYFSIEVSNKFSIYYDYVFFVGTKKS